MATKQWLVENPKVLGYLPKNIYDQLQEFKAEQKVSVSRALTMILENYFELESFEPPADSCTDGRLTNLEQQVAAIKVAVNQLANHPSSSEDVVAAEETSAEQPSSTTDDLQPRILRFSKNAIIPANSSSSLEKKENTNKSQPTVTKRSHQDSSSEEPPIYKTVRIPRDQSVVSEEATEQTATNTETTSSQQSKEHSEDNLQPPLPKSRFQLGGRKVQKFFKGFSPPSLKPSDQDQD